MEVVYTILLTLLLSSLVSKILCTLIVRQNYGVIFKKKGLLDSSNSDFHLTFALPHLTLPASRSLPKFCEEEASPLSGKIVDICTEIKPILMILQHRRQALRQEIANNDRQMQLLVPQTIRGRARNRKEAWFPAFSRLLSDLTGLGAQEDIEILTRQVTHLENTFNRSAGTMAMFEEELHAYLEHTNNRVTNAFSMLEQNTADIENITQELKGWRDELIMALESQLESALHLYMAKITKLLNYIIVVLVQEIDSLEAINTAGKARIESFSSMSKSNLNAKLVTPAELQKALIDLQQILRKKYPMFSLKLNPSFYFHLQNTVYTRTADYLLVKVRIPMSTKHSLYDAFQVIHFPIPITTTTSSLNNTSTMLHGVSSYLALSKQQDRFIELSKNEWASCQGKHNLKRCNEPLLILSNRVMTCTRALYIDNPQMVMKHCGHSVVLNSQATKPQVLPAGHGKILIIAPNAKLYLQCKDKEPELIPGSSWAMITIPCKCQLSAMTFTIPPSLNNCRRGISKHRVLYPVNLAAIYKLFGQKHLYNMTGTSLALEPWQFKLPKLNFANAAPNWNSVQAADTKIKMDLEKLAAKMRDSKPIYIRQMDELHEESGLGSVFYSRTWSAALPMGGLILSIAALILAIYSTVTSCRQAVVLTALCASLPRTRAEAVEISATELTILQALILRLQHVTYIALVVLTVLIVVRLSLVMWDTIKLRPFLGRAMWILRHPYRPRPHSKIVLEICSVNQYLAVEVMSIPVSPHHVYIGPFNQIKRLSLEEKCLSACLIIDWGCPTLMIDENCLELNLPRVINLNVYCANKN